MVCMYFLASCKKENNPPNSNNTSLVRTYTEELRSSVVGNSLTAYTLSYDENNHLTGMTSTPAPPAISFIYKFPSTASATLDLYDQGNLSLHEVFYLNSQGFMDSTFQYNDTNDSTTEKYIYNSGQQLLQQKTYNFFSTGAQLSSTLNYTYDNTGNVASTADDQGQTITYTYYSDMANTLNLGKTLLPQGKNLINTATLNDNGTTETTRHFYSFDSNNRLIKDSSSVAELDLIGIKSYTY